MTRRIAVRLVLAALVAALVPFAPHATASVRSSAAPRAYQPGVVLVSFQPSVGAPARSALHAAFGGQIVGRLAWQNLDVVRLPSGTTPVAAASRYSSSPR